MSPLCSTGPSFANHLGNNSEQPGLVLEAESTTCSAVLQGLPANALRQSIAQPHTTQTAPTLKYNPLRVAPSDDFSSSTPLDFLLAAHTHSRPPPPKPQIRAARRLLPAAIAERHEITRLSPLSPAHARSRQQSPQLPCFSLLLPCKP
jgi:hypothetical protein